MTETLVGRYELEAPPGRGAVGEVWRGWDLATRQQVAVKRVQLATIDDPVLVAEATARFRRVADMLARLRHPNIISGLAAAHAIGVVHRDIKPSNLTVSARGQLTVVDFDIARLLEDTSPRLAAPSETAGTLLCLSPGQAAGIDVHVAGTIFANGNSGPVSYQWAKDGENLPIGTVTAARVRVGLKQNLRARGPITPQRSSSSSRPT